MSSLSISLSIIGLSNDKICFNSFKKSFWDLSLLILSLFNSYNPVFVLNIKGYSNNSSFFSLIFLSIWVNSFIKELCSKYCLSFLINSEYGFSVNNFELLITFSSFSSELLFILLFFFNSELRILFKKNQFDNMLDC